MARGSQGPSVEHFSNALRSYFRTLRISSCRRLGVGIDEVLPLALGDKHYYRVGEPPDTVGLVCTISTPSSIDYIQSRGGASISPLGTDG